MTEETPRPAEGQPAAPAGTPRRPIRARRPPPPRPRGTPLVFGVFAALALLMATFVVGLAIERGIVGGAARSAAPSGSPAASFPPLVDGPGLAAFFAQPPSAPVVTSVGPATLEIREGPALRLPDGRLIAADVFFLGDHAPFAEALPPGETAVTLLVAAFGEDRRFAAVLVGDRSRLAGLRWAAAAVEGQDQPGPDEVITFPVDSGTAAFTSVAGRERVRTDAEFDDRVLEALADVDYADAFRVPLDDARTLDVVGVPAGWGDGSYATWVGTDGEGAAVAYLTSFDVLDRPA